MTFQHEWRGVALFKFPCGCKVQISVHFYDSAALIAPDLHVEPVIVFPCKKHEDLVLAETVGHRILDYVCKQYDIKGGWPELFGDIESFTDEKEEAVVVDKDLEEFLRLEVAPS